MNLLLTLPILTGKLRNSRQPWLESIIAVLILLVAWLYGFVNTRSAVAPLVPNVLPGTQRVETHNEIFTAYDGYGTVLGYAAAADATTGYGGPVYLLVGIDPAGKIAGIQVIEQHETPGFYGLLRKNQFIESFMDLPIGQPIVVGETVDSVSGASLSAEAVAQAINNSVSKIQSGVLEPTPPTIRFGLPEISLLVLITGSLSLSRIKKTTLKKTLRWSLLLTSMVVLGFILNRQLTLANFASLLAGYWPTWQDHLYWYLLLGSVIGYAILKGKNIYCFIICPFGAAQECLGKLSDAKPYLPAPIYQRLKWMPRWLAVLSLALGLAFRQPGAGSYEPFGTLFSLSAGFFPWMLLVIVLFASMIILRPFCHYLCPVGATMDFILFIRSQVNRLWRTKQTVPALAASRAQAAGQSQARSTCYESSINPTHPDA